MNREDLLSECYRLSEHVSLPDFFNHLDEFIVKLGFKQFMYTTLPDSQKNIPANPIIKTSFASDWIEYYLANDYASHDMVSHHLMEPNSSVCIWNEHINRKPVSRIQSKIYDEANEAGCTNGITIPLRNHIGIMGVLSLTFEGSKDKFDRFYKERSHALLVFAEAFNQSILDCFYHHLGGAQKPQISSREQEVLQWIARGLTNDQVSDKLKIGVFTVRKHLTNVMHKLGARNTTQAVAIAIKWRIIR